MKNILLISLMVGCASTLAAQTKDSAYYQRVDDRLAIMMDHFTANVSSDSQWIDTVEYTQRIFAHHLETIRLRTNLERHRKPQYAYAVQLRDKKLKSILSTDIQMQFYRSLQNKVSGFMFCRVCNYGRLEDATHCGNCGEEY